MTPEQSRAAARARMRRHRSNAEVWAAELARQRERYATDPRLRQQRAGYNHSFTGVVAKHRYHDRLALERLESLT